MELVTVSSTRETVIVVVDANRNAKNAEALDWAIRHVVRPKDVVILLGVLHKFRKKSFSCFPFGISGILEKLEFSAGHGEVNPEQLGKELERKRREYQTNLDRFHRQCRKNEVKLEIKIAAGYCPGKIAVKEAKNSNIRWIVLDRHLKKHEEYIYGHVGCHLAIMKGDTATWLPLKVPLISETSPEQNWKSSINNDEFSINNDGNFQETKSSTQQPARTPQTPHWFPLSWRSGYPRNFDLKELEEMTNGFSDENKLQVRENVEIYQGTFQDTPLIIKSFLEDDDRFWSMLTILCRVRHRNIMNIIGYCCTGTSRFILNDFPCSGTVQSNLFDDESAKKLTWEARWYIALEIGGCLRYLHEESDDGPIVHQSVCSAHIFISQAGSATLCNFLKAKWLSHAESSAEHPNSEKYEKLSVDVRDYGMFLVELITGKSALRFPEEGEGQCLVDWAVPLLKEGSLNQVMDPRLTNIASDMRVVKYMAQAALLCLKAGDSRQIGPSISEVLAVVRGDQLAISKY